MGDERERMAQDIDALKARLLKVTKQWEALYGVLFVKAQRLSDDNVALRAEILVLKTALAQIDEFCAEAERQDGPRASLPTKWLRKHVGIAVAGRLLKGNQDSP